MIFAEVTLGTTELVATVAMLTAVSLTFGILSKSSGWFDKKVHGIVTKRQQAMQEDLTEIKSEQKALKAQMNNGIKKRLDDLEEAHERTDTKLDGLATDLAHLTGMMELHLNWTGIDRRETK